MKNREWFRFNNAAADASIAEIQILDVIGSWDDDWIARNFGYDMGVTARAFVEQLAALPEDVKALHVHINSPGGDVQAGINIANALRQWASKGRTVETFIDGMAASIASVIAMAGSKVHIADNALFMIHDPWSIGIGNAGEMRKLADILDTMRDQAVATYRWHSELEPEAIAALMAAETWMDASEAIANGFATDKVEGLRAAASIDPRAAAKLTVPDKFKDRVKAFVKQDAPTPPAPVAASAIEVMRLCREGGCMDLAEGLVTAQATVETVTTKVAEAKDVRAAAEARATEITAICANAKLPELTAGYVNGGMAIADIKAHIVTLTAKLASAEIDGGLDPSIGPSAAGSWKNAFAKVKRHSLRH
jgi:ATP-dependent protease ClpP protease subunit